MLSAISQKTNFYCITSTKLVAEISLILIMFLSNYTVSIMEKISLLDLDFKCGEHFTFKQLYTAIIIIGV